MENRDEKLWRAATQRVRFKRHVFTYVAVNIFLWCLWYFTHQNHETNGLPWPAWTSLGWGFGLLMNYIRVYHSDTDNQIEKEYEKLKNN